MSNPNNNLNEWSQFYNNQTFLTASTVSTASTAAITATTDSRLSPEVGRVSKPARRRSRASRRTPTTLLNTDTSNFRAMVQQFTGGPSSMAASSGFSLTSSSSEPYGQQNIPSWQYNFQNQQQQRPYMFSLNNVVVGFDNMMNPNTVAPAGGGGSAPATEPINNNNNTCSSSSSARLR